MLRMNRIDLPKWASPFYRDVDDAFGDTQLNAILHIRELLLQTVQDEVQKYIDDDSLTFDTESDGFPSRDRLTG